MMNTDTVVRTEKKKVMKFLLFLLGCFVLGAISGGMMGFLGDKNLMPVKEKLVEFLSDIAPFLFIACNVILLILSLISYMKAKHQYSQWDGVDETVIDNIEYQLNYPMVFSNIAVILNLAFFAIMIFFIEANYYQGSFARILEKGIVAIFFLGLAWTIVMNNCTVNFVKKLNPEKQGSVFDNNFQKQWEESCDEGQKLIIYKSAYAAFKWVNYICISLWVLGVIGIFSFHTGVLPVIFVCIIYFISNMAFMVTSIKLEKL
ncbi:MAG: DUF3169 family protein [Eubacterium sp.]|nr:DUF3169 family protein [Eubacterium sp.]